MWIVNQANGARPGQRPGRTGAEENSIIGESAGLLSAKALARRVATDDIPVLILGETGTGKELLANYIHDRSERSGYLVDVDCGALPEELVESLLFGHKRGAFTGAVNHAKGLLVEADGGSLFLDELANLSLSGQAKLLRVLESGEVRRVGGSRARAVNFRVIATAQGSLAQRVRAEEFRQDLLQRIAGVVIELPTLAARIDDIPLLADHFALRKGLQVTTGGKDYLQDQDWPGNIRQLKWTISRGGLFHTDGWIDRNAVQRALETGPKLIIPSNERDDDRPTTTSLIAVCRHHRGNADRIAETLGIGRSTLYRRLRAEGLSLRQFRRAAETADASPGSGPRAIDR